MVLYDGTAVWEVSGRFDSICMLSLAKFPFDKQICSLDIEMATFWDALLSKFNSVNFDDETRTNPAGYISSSDIWQLKKLRNETTKDGSGISFKFEFQRKAEAYYTILFLPMAQLNVLQVCVFLMPADSTDRPGFSITVFLASSVLLSLFEASIPLTSETMYLKVNFGTQITLGVFITVWILISNRLTTHEKYRQKVSVCFGGFKMRLIDYVDSIVCLISFLAYISTNAIVLSLLLSQ